MSDEKKLELDLYAINEEAKQKDKIRANPKKYEVTKERAEEIMASLKPVENLKDILVA